MSTPIVRPAGMRPLYRYCRTTSKSPLQVLPRRSEGLRARLRGEDDDSGSRRNPPLPGRRTGWAGAADHPETGDRGLLSRLRLAAALLVVFLISASAQSGGVPSERSGARAGRMLTSADTVLVLGTDQRPTGPAPRGRRHRGRREPDRHVHAVADRRRHLAAALDPAGHAGTIPGHREQDQRGLSFGGPALALKAIKQFTGIKINHLIVVDLANFPKFVDAIGGVTVKTGRICSKSRRRRGWRLHPESGAGHPPSERPGR